MDNVKCQAQLWHDSSEDWFLDLLFENGTAYTLPLREYDVKRLTAMGVGEKLPIDWSDDKTKQP